MCKKGCQTCFECPLVLCHDNNHALRIQALEQAVLHFTYSVAELKRRLARKDELLESTTAVVHRHQADAEEHRERLEHLREAIRVNQKDADEKGGHWDELDASDQQDLGELEHYIAGLQAALQIMDTDGRVDAKRGDGQEALKCERAAVEASNDQYYESAYLELAEQVRELKKRIEEV